MHNNNILPGELLHDVFQHIEDYRTLSLIASVCRAFVFEAERLLYKEAPKNLSPTRHIKFLDSVTEEPRLAAMVRRYVLPNMAGPQRARCCERLRIALPMMVNLKELSISASMTEIKILPMHKVTFEVEALTWIPFGIADNDMSGRWIESQTQTKHLRWIQKQRIVVSHGAFPNLISLEGNLHVINALLPNRKIRRLHWIAESSPTEFEISEQLITGLQNLQVLSFENRFNPIEYGAISQHLISLTFLELIGYHNKPDVRTLCIPSTLLILVFSFGPARSNDALHDANRAATVETLFRKGPNLLTIYIAQDRATNNGVYYERWENGACFPELFHSDSVHRVVY